VSCRTRQTSHQSENIAGSPPKNVDSASLLSQAVHRNAGHVWGERAAHQAHASAARGSLTTQLKKIPTGSAVSSPEDKIPLRGTWTGLRGGPV